MDHAALWVLLMEIVHDVEDLHPDGVVPEEVPASAVEPLIEAARVPPALDSPAAGVHGVHQELTGPRGVGDASDLLAVELEPGANRHRHHLGRISDHGKESGFLHESPSSNLVAAVDLKDCGDGIALQDEHDVGDRLALAVLLDVLGQPVQVLDGGLEHVRALEHLVVLIVGAAGVEVVLDASGLDGIIGPAADCLDVGGVHG